MRLSDKHGTGAFYRVGSEMTQNVGDASLLNAELTQKHCGTMTDNYYCRKTDYAISTQKLKLSCITPNTLRRGVCTLVGT